jgi:hypothetical protein
MFWRRKRPSILTLDIAAIEEQLRGFEDEHFEVTGERLTSAEFYDRYRDGEDLGFESGRSIRWASYYELLRAQGQEALTSAPDQARLKRAAIA